MEDITLTCIQCEAPFVFTTPEQNYYHAHDFDPPLRCPVCRKQKTKANALPFKKGHKIKNKDYFRRYEAEL